MLPPSSAAPNNLQPALPTGPILPVHESHLPDAGQLEAEAHPLAAGERVDGDHPLLAGLLVRAAREPHSADQGAGGGAVDGEDVDGQARAGVGGVGVEEGGVEDFPARGEAGAEGAGAGGGGGEGEG